MYVGRLLPKYSQGYCENQYWHTLHSLSLRCFDLTFTLRFLTGTLRFLVACRSRIIRIHWK
jgi:hypothetical protein